MVNQREQLRAQRQFAEADAVRAQLLGMGVYIDDKARKWSDFDGNKGTVPTWQ